MPIRQSDFLKIILEDRHILCTEKYPEQLFSHLNIFRVIWGDRKTANFDEHMTAIFRTMNGQKRQKFGNFVSTFPSNTIPAQPPSVYTPHSYLQLTVPPWRKSFQFGVSCPLQ